MTIKALQFVHKDSTFYLCLLPASTLAKISYVARRGIDEEKGAVQRILNKGRITGIKDFILDNGFFPNNIILNVSSVGNLQYDLETHNLTIEDEARIAQIIDGQHRVEGLKEAMKIDESIGNRWVPTVLCKDLDTSACAEIFLSINTEQKAVPKSLIYDLYGLLDSTDKDFSIERGSDIAKLLNTDETSPYQGYIKIPGSRRFKGGIQLSTFVNSLKPLVRIDGEFNKYGISTLDYQVNILKNYFNAIQSYYGEEWDVTSNPFLFASGFSAAISVFIHNILPNCYAAKKFTEQFFKEILVIPADALIRQTEVKGMSGESAVSLLRDRLQAFVTIETKKEEDFEI